MTHADVTLKDARRGQLIHSKDMVKLREKATRPDKTRGETPVVIEVPRELVNIYRNIRLFVDVMNMNKVAFLYTISENINFRTSSYLKVETKMSLFESMKKVIKKYEDSSFKVKFVDADMQFECLEDDFRGIIFKIVDTDDHTHAMERFIRIMKEGTRSIVVDMPFLCMTIVMIKCIVALSTRNLNQFPLENSISNKYSSLIIITGVPLADARKYTINFGSYVKTFEDNGIMQNSTRTRGIPVTCLSSAPYRKPGQYFM